jgi:hypothetical protein
VGLGGESTEKIQGQSGEGCAQSVIFFATAYRIAKLPPSNESEDESAVSSACSPRASFLGTSQDKHDTAWECVAVHAAHRAALEVHIGHVVPATLKRSEQEQTRK